MTKARNITITLEKAKEWYNSDNATLKKVALQAFSEEELRAFDFTEIKTFDDAFKALGYSNDYKVELEEIFKRIFLSSRASVAMFKLSIIRRALNKGYDLHLTKNADGQSDTWQPFFRFITSYCTFYDNSLESGELQTIGKIKDGKDTYLVIGGVADDGCNGLGDFRSDLGVGYSYFELGFLGCATKEIASHFIKYFGMLIMEAMYGDLVDFKIVK